MYMKSLYINSANWSIYKPVVNYSSSQSGLMHYVIMYTLIPMFSHNHYDPKIQFFLFYNMK